MTQSTGEDAHRAALVHTLKRRATAQGTITLPAVPALLDEYVELCLTTFTALGVEFDASQRAELIDVLEAQLREAFAASPRSQIVITYDAPVGHLVNYHVRPQWESIERTYDNWVETREAPYFGLEPDARVWALASTFDDPKACTVLDIGAGAGRNALALARRGHPVDALEVSGRFADLLREQARAQSLGIRVIQRDLFDAVDYLPGDYGLIVMSEVASDFRGARDLHQVFSLVERSLLPDGLFVMNAFIAKDGYEPDDAVRQLGQQTYSAVFTRADLDDALAGLRLSLVDDAAVYDFEAEHLPEGTWPPTGWFEGWVLGQDLFAMPRPDVPIEMRWLVYRRVVQETAAH